MAEASKLPFDLEAFARKERAALSKGKRLAKLYQRHVLVKEGGNYHKEMKIRSTIEQMSQLKTKVIPEAVVLP